MIRHFLLTLALLGAGNQIVAAQPAPNNAPKADNPANLEGGIDVQKRFAEVLRMTPEQRKEMMRKTQEQGLRASFNRAGFKDLKLQDTIIAFVAEQEKSRDAVRQAAAKVYLALATPEAPDAAQKMDTLLSDYLEAVDDAKTARETQTEALDQEIKFSANPQLMAMLTLSGIIGDAAFFNGDIIMTGTMGFTGIAPFMFPARVLPGGAAN